jgi:hypothetical protein
MTGPLARAVADAVARLGRFGSSYPVYLAPPSGYEIVTAEDMLQPERLGSYCERAITAWTQHPEEEDIRAAASRLMRRYCGSLASATFVPLAHGVALDVSLPRVAFLIRDEMPMGVVLDLSADGPWVSPERPTAWPLDDARSVATLAELRERAWLSLFSEHLAPAIERVLSYAKLNPKVLWSTAAEQIDLLYENALDGFGPTELANLSADREVALFASTLPGLLGANPLRNLLTWETVADQAFPRPLQVREICCVCFVIPGRNAYCRTCGLISQEERLTLWRSWRASVADQEAASRPA